MGKPCDQTPPTYLDLRNFDAKAKSSKHKSPNGGLMVMNPMVESIKKSPPKNTSKHRNCATHYQRWTGGSRNSGSPTVRKVPRLQTNTSPEKCWLADEMPSVTWSFFGDFVKIFRGNNARIQVRGLQKMALRLSLLLLMAEMRWSIVEVGSLYHCLQCFIHPRWLAGFLNHQQLWTCVMLLCMAVSLGLL